MILSLMATAASAVLLAKPTKVDWERMPEKSTTPENSNEVALAHVFGGTETLDIDLVFNDPPACAIK